MIIKYIQWAVKPKWGTKEKVTYRFSVVDLDRGEYPANWVCLLPKGARERLEKSNFANTIKVNDPYLFALDLLSSARTEYSDDPGIVTEIDSRLFILQHLRARSRSTIKK